MLHRIAIPFLSLFFFTACVSEPAEIRSICETNDIGDYIIKWETFPRLKGSLKIYEMLEDSVESSVFITEQPIKDGITTIFGNQSLKRRYFELVFKKKYTYHVAERLIKADKVYNLRDIGGYANKEKKQVKWGKIYRSSSIAKASKKDMEKLESLGIKTVIDCRTGKEKEDFPVKYKAPQIFDLQMRGVDIDLFKEKIEQGEMKRGDVLIMQQDLYVNLLEKNTDYLQQVFDILLNKENYPVLIHCSLGKDRAGVLTALILAALEVNREQITQDYMLSNRYIDFNNIVSNAEDLPYDVQEALTTLLGANEKTLDYTMTRISKDYGSLNNYLEKELKLTHKKREKLKENLLY